MKEGPSYCYRSIRTGSGTRQLYWELSSQVMFQNPRWSLTTFIQNEEKTKRALKRKVYIHIYTNIHIHTFVCNEKTHTFAWTRSRSSKRCAHTSLRASRGFPSASSTLDFRRRASKWSGSRARHMVHSDRESAYLPHFSKAAPLCVGQERESMLCWCGGGGSFSSFSLQLSRSSTKY